MRIRMSLLAVLLLGLVSCDKKQVAPIESYVVVVSLDGFRWDYPDLYPTVSLDAMEKAGVKAESLIPSFPTKTFPNHYSLASGLYPDHHGIINNTFWAEDLGDVYRIRNRDLVMDGKAYGGEPIWISTERQGRKSASYFWVGSEADIKGMHPSYWKRYDESIPYGDRIDQVIDWLELPMHIRPSLVMLYLDEPDHTGHDAGPADPRTGLVVTELDSLIGVLRGRIAALEFSERVNLIVLSDHGMGSISPDRYVNILEAVPESWIDFVHGGNPVYLVDPAEGMADTICSVLNGLEGVSAWQQDDVPAHLHYGTHSRFPGIVVVADSLWSIGLKPLGESSYTGGAHGYDNRFRQMHAIFYAEGPAFKSGYSRPSFENVEVYGIVAHILGLEPAKTDGDLERVADIFAEP